MIQTVLEVNEAMGASVKNPVCPAAFAIACS
jgi:hypothetical protein